MILPEPGEGFVWQSFGAQMGLVCCPLGSQAAHVFTTRDWPLGTESDPAAWAEVARAVDVDNRVLWRAHQVHGAGVVCGGRATRDPLPEGDIVVAVQAGHAAAVQMADCVPLLIADRATGVVAAVHAGWRGLAARAPRVAIDTLVARHGSRAENLIVAVGPSIGACCYEVGPDVRRAFEDARFAVEALARWFGRVPTISARNPGWNRVGRSAGPTDETRWFLDTWASAADQVIEAGVPSAQVFVCGLCTASHPSSFCSFRREGRAAGRLAAAIRCATHRP